MSARADSKRREWLRVSLALRPLVTLQEMLQDRADRDDFTITLDVDQLNNLVDKAVQYLYDKKKELQ